MSNIEPINSKDGKIYWVDSTDKLYIQRLRIGQYQGHNWRFAQSLIDTWDRCIDVGSNNACNAINYAELFDQVECFEPTPLAQQLWQNTVRDNGVTNCRLHLCAVGEQQKTTDIIIHEHNGGHNHLDNSDRPRWTGKIWQARTPKPRQRQTTTVTVNTIDSYDFQSVGFIKVDVEGYERFVLEGSQQTIDRCRPTIQLEIVSGQCRKFGYWAEDMIEWIRSWDYQVISRNRGHLEGKFQSYRNRLLYNGEYYKGEMDLWFQPSERMRKTVFTDLFEYAT